MTGLSQRLVWDVGRRDDDKIAFPAIARSRTEENIDIALYRRRGQFHSR